MIQRYVQDFRRFQVESIMGSKKLPYAIFWANEYSKKDGREIIDKVLTENFVCRLSIKTNSTCCRAF